MLLQAIRRRFKAVKWNCLSVGGRGKKSSLKACGLSLLQWVIGKELQALSLCGWYYRALVLLLLALS